VLEEVVTEFSQSGVGIISDELGEGVGMSWEDFRYCALPGTRL